MTDAPPNSVDLSTFDNTWYFPGRGMFARIAWVLVSGVFFQTWVPWPSAWKAMLLRTFGAKVGTEVVIKPRVTIKYPWHVALGDHAWIGEGAWLDSLARIDIGAHACLSQGCMIETGNHHWGRRSFDLIVAPVIVGQGAWAAVGTLLLPGAELASHAVLCAGSVLSGTTEPFGIYSGSPASRSGRREIACSTSAR